MGLKLTSSSLKRGLKHYMTMKAARKRLGLTGKSKLIRQLKRSFKAGTVDTGAGVSSASSYQYQPRTLSQLTGGV